MVAIISQEVQKIQTGISSGIPTLMPRLTRIAVNDTAIDHLMKYRQDIIFGVIIVEWIIIQLNIVLKFALI